MRPVQRIAWGRERPQASVSSGGTLLRLRAEGRELRAQAARPAQVSAEAPRPRLRERRPRPAPLLPAGLPAREREGIARRQAWVPRSIRLRARTALAIDSAREPARRP